ncbi:Eco57I restriction-modification methylase domain-containing protein [Butyrivibrio fibrisolvens]|uniref:Eco57I restriction-modification methylase domain-containing protein n=1 Tax=Butyrivibrio fibrisolvens TaxID=831 RepID=UPI00040D3235|nr:N-6 DNA methylase [Butyrivibrio fibrisolvens]
MSVDLKGINNQNEYYTNHYFATVFEENEADTISKWRNEAHEDEGVRTPWSYLRDAARSYGVVHERYLRSGFDMQTLANIKDLADKYMLALGYPEAHPEKIQIDDETTVPVYLEVKKSNGAPFLWILLGASEDKDAGILERSIFDTEALVDGSTMSVPDEILTTGANEDLATKILFALDEPPRFLIFIGMNQIALIDRNKWNEKRYLQFDLDDIFGRREETTLQAMAVLLHKDSLCPDGGKVLLDEFDEESQRNASGVSKDLKYALRESIELLGNEVLYDMKNRQGLDLIANPVDASELTIQCLRYMYRMLFVLFIESRSDLGYAPMKSPVYFSAYSLESLRDIAESVREDIEEVGESFYLFDTLEKLYNLIYSGYPDSDEKQKKLEALESKHDVFQVAPLKAHIFDPERTAIISNSKVRNSVMLKIIDLMSITKGNGKKGSRGRISYSNLGINQMGAVYEALLSYRGFIAERDLYEVKAAGTNFDELEVGYFVPEENLDQYTEEERVYTTDGNGRKVLRMYEKGKFIYRLAGREREKSASYYTPEVLTKCLVKYALKELLKDKSADEILQLNICEPAMGSAAFLNEAINQLAEAYLEKKEKELGETISYDKRQNELQKVKMYIADRNVYGIDLNPTAVELAEVSLWLNTIYEGGFVPWFGTQLVNGNSLIGARKQCYTVSQIQTAAKGMRWYESTPERVPFGTTRKPRTQVYHFLLGDPGMSAYNDKVIKKLEPDNIKKIDKWRKEFTKPFDDNDAKSLLDLSKAIDDLWDQQVALRKEVDEKTQDNLSVYGHEDTEKDSHTTIREKDRIFSELYKSEHMKNAGPYARLKFAMDYWCALWFWPIDQADLLPSRSEFLFEMSIVLIGTQNAVHFTSKEEQYGQMSLFPTEYDQLAFDFAGMNNNSVVDLPWIMDHYPRLKLAHEIAERQRFMHWELEFADLFAEKGGFDLVIGNPPWITVKWKESNFMSDLNPIFEIRKITAAETAKLRTETLQSFAATRDYIHEYENSSGAQNYYSSISNYPLNSGLSNLYKLFIPLSWQLLNIAGVSSFLHPEGVFDDPTGSLLREHIYKHLVYHFQFVNELFLFKEIHDRTTFSINVYKNKNEISFVDIANLFTPTTIEDCYTENNNLLYGLKDNDNNWNIKGHKDRVISIGRKELEIFAGLFDNSTEWKSARLPAVHSVQIIDTFNKLYRFSTPISEIHDEFFSTSMWVETDSLKRNIIRKNEHFAENLLDEILSGSHIAVGNPLFKSSRRQCSLNSDFDCIDLQEISDDYIQRCKYSIGEDISDYIERIPNTQWGEKYTENYRIIARLMMNSANERTLISAILPPKIGHINGLLGIAVKNPYRLIMLAGSMESIVFDFYIKTTGMTNLRESSLMGLPLLEYNQDVAARVLLLNTLTCNYSDLWNAVWNDEYKNCKWAKHDERLDDGSFSKLSSVWSSDFPLRNDYCRRQALVEIDVLVGMLIGMSLKQLQTIYRIQFPVLQSYENDTWYDRNGRIVFTSNRSLTNVGFSRSEWENGIKDAQFGQKFYRTIIDDTIPNGPVERTVEYVAPFDKCDREHDYEIAWKYFEGIYSKK